MAYLTTMYSCRYIDILPCLLSWSCLVLPCLVLSCLALPCLVFSCLVLSTITVLLICTRKKMEKGETSKVPKDGDVECNQQWHLHRVYDVLNGDWLRRFSSSCTPTLLYININGKNLYCQNYFFWVPCTLAIAIKCLWYYSQFRFSFSRQNSGTISQYQPVPVPVPILTLMTINLMLPGNDY